ncbi:hypothetical protein JT358_08485 [Micrococcales bacterium 31B]|nr:hypothetical protein [Micrococcales bacterium 31B]
MSAEFLGLTVGLGLAGFDSVPFFVALTLLWFGVRRLHVAAYLLVIAVAPIAIGILLAALLAPWLGGLDLRGMLREGFWPAFLEAVLALALAWSAWRALSGARPLLADLEIPQKLGLLPQLGLGVFALGGIVFDPAYLAFQVAAARQPIGALVLGEVLWLTVAQCLLVPAAVLVALASRDRVEKVRAWWEAGAARRQRWLGIIPAAVSLVLAADLLTLWFTGSYLLWG